MLIDKIRKVLDDEYCGSNTQFDRFERAWDATMTARATPLGIDITAHQPDTRHDEYVIRGVDGFGQYDKWVLITKLFRHLRVRNALIEVLGEPTMASRGKVLLWEIDENQKSSD